MSGPAPARCTRSSRRIAAAQPAKKAPKVSKPKKVTRNPKTLTAMASMNSEKVKRERSTSRMISTDKGQWIKKDDVPNKTEVLKLFKAPKMDLSELFHHVLKTPLCSQIYADCEQTFSWLKSIPDDYDDLSNGCDSISNIDVLPECLKESYESLVKYFQPSLRETAKRKEAVELETKKIPSLSIIIEESTNRTTGSMRYPDASKTIKQIHFPEGTPTNRKEPKVYRKTPHTNKLDGFRGRPLLRTVVSPENEEVPVNGGDSARRVKQAFERKQQYLKEKADRVRRERDRYKQKMTYNQKQLEKHKEKTPENRAFRDARYEHQDVSDDQEVTYTYHLRRASGKNRLNECDREDVPRRVGLLVEATPEIEHKTIKYMGYIDCIPDGTVVSDSLEESEESTSVSSMAQKDTPNTHSEANELTEAEERMPELNSRSRIHVGHAFQLETESEEVDLPDVQETQNYLEGLDDTMALFSPGSVACRKDLRKTRQLVASYMSSSSSYEPFQGAGHSSVAQRCELFSNQQSVSHDRCSDNVKNGTLITTAAFINPEESIVTKGSKKTMETTAINAAIRGDAKEGDKEIGTCDELGEAPMEIDGSQSTPAHQDDTTHTMHNERTSRSGRVRTTSTKFSDRLTSESSKALERSTEAGQSDEETRKSDEAEEFSSVSESSESTTNRSDYGVSDLSSQDETDPEDAPKKKIPSWATGIALRNALREQRLHPSIDVDEFFSEIRVPDLKQLFPKHRSTKQRLRSASGIWDSPINRPRIGASALEAVTRGTHDFDKTVRLEPYAQ